MNTKFDELTKSMAQSVTRRAALKKFAGLAGMALACFGLANKGNAQQGCIPSIYSIGRYLENCKQCCSGAWTRQWLPHLDKGGKYKNYYCA
jgi:hypothetical protein